MKRKKQMPSSAEMVKTELVRKHIRLIIYQDLSVLSEWISEGSVGEVTGTPCLTELISVSQWEKTSGICCNVNTLREPKHEFRNCTQAHHPSLGCAAFSLKLSGCSLGTCALKGVHMLGPDIWVLLQPNSWKVGCFWFVECYFQRLSD